MLVLELLKNSVDIRHLTECQKCARDGLYSEAMGGFVCWLACELEDKRAWLAHKVTEYRHRALSSSGHARIPDIVANLQAGFELFLKFSVECGAIGQAERDRSAECCWEALLNAAAEQGKHQAETEPASRFLALLRSLLASGRAHLEARDGGEPDHLPGSCGWHPDNSGRRLPLGECLGWVGDDGVYLEPSAAFRAVQVAATWAKYWQYPSTR